MEENFIYKVCELTIQYSRIIPDRERIKAITPCQMASAFYQFYDKNSIELTETAYAMILNNNFKMIGMICVGMGTNSDAIIDQKKVLQAALLCNGNVVALCHNHPSFNLAPSRMDDEVTSRLSNACKSIGVKLIDHIIIAPDGNYYSYSENGKL
ncbi:MAG: JAB domain-containing protein [Alloprevotella sp.]